MNTNTNHHHKTLDGDKIKVGIVGATGYTGIELIRLLSAHSRVEIVALTSRTHAGQKVNDVFDSLQTCGELVFVDFDLTVLCGCDVVFFATPHGVAMQSAPTLVQAGVKVIDLAADFRLQDLAEFEHWYGMTHTCPDILTQSVYGLPEVNRAFIKSAQVIANPGCYPTTAILGLKPIIEAQNQADLPLIDKHIVIDAKSGVSGAGRNAKMDLIFSEVADNFKAYGVSGHRHLPEIRQGVMNLLASRHEQKIRFVPHLVPMIRGMYSTIHLNLTSAGCQVDWQQLFCQCYQDEYFVQVLPKGVLPQTKHARASNFLKIAIHQDNGEGVLTVMVVQDNLVKGASGQAVQNMNILFGLPEWTGLQASAVV